MSARKSMVHSTVEEMRKQSESPSSPRRRSLIAARNVFPVRLVENDDEAERQIRRLSKNQSESPAAQTGSSRKSLSFGAITEMTHPQIVEKIAQCMKLNAENKINIKNAFSLEMIDLMAYMIKKKDKNMNNLQVASTALDISSKIYGYRVDGVYMDVLKMAGGLGKQEKKQSRDRDNDVMDDNNGNNDNNDRDSDPAHETNDNARKKRKSKKKILVSAESLKGLPLTMDPTSMMMQSAESQTTDMLEQANLPLYLNCGFYRENRKDVLLDTVDPNAEYRTNDSVIPIKNIGDYTQSEMCPTYANFEMLGWSADEEMDENSLPPTQSPEIRNEFQFDLDASLPDDDGVGNRTDNDFITEEEGTNVREFQRGNRSAENLVDFREVVKATNVNKTSEYSYIQNNLNIPWAGPSFWKVRFPPKQVDGTRIVEHCRQQAARRRKEVVLSFDDDIADLYPGEKYATANGSSIKLQAKTLKITWDNGKWTLPRDMHYDSDSILCKYYRRPDAPINLPRKDQMDATHIPDEAADYNYENENDTTDYCPNIECNAQQLDHDNSNNAFEFDQLTGVSTQAFIGDNLVQAPKITTKILLPYSQRAKKIDMQKLKKVMWRHLKRTIGTIDKSDVSGTMFEEDPNKVNKTEKFNDLYKVLPTMLSESNAESLSVPIALMSLLHLANEKNLEIKSVANLTDLVIRQSSDS